MPPSLRLPLERYRGLRTIDPFGGGGFGAPRKRDGRLYSHRGLDVRVQVGDVIIAPCDCRIDRLGRAYNDPASDLGSMHLVNGPVRIKMLYVQPSETLTVGVDVIAGNPIGLAQDVSAYHSRPGREMQNHIHIELYIDDILVDPTKYFQIPAEPLA